MFENTKILRFAMFANTFLYIFSLLTTAKIVSFQPHRFKSISGSDNYEVTIYPRPVYSAYFMHSAKFFSILLQF